MGCTVATHNGGFHADDVLAFALIRQFHDADARLVRTRDPDLLAQADLVVDVGGELDPSRGRFDHHQNAYTGERSSAGLVLDWLEAQGQVTPGLAQVLRHELVDYVDAVDNGRRTPERGVPCFTSLVGSYNEIEPADGDPHGPFLAAAAMARDVLEGVQKGFARTEAARVEVVAEMEQAPREGRAVLCFDRYLPWKGAYFDNGGVEHPSDFVLFPAEGRWRVVAIPPEPGSFAKKRPFPESWAGLENEELAAVVGVPGSLFCHKNRFIAVFASREAAVEALQRWQLWQR